MIHRWSPSPVSDADREGYLGHLERRFGIPVAAFDPYALWRPNPKELALVPRALAAPGAPPALWQGLVILHIRMWNPKPTTAAAQMFGPLATRNVVVLDRLEDARAFLAREDLAPTPAQLEQTTGPGWVFLAHRGHVLGVGQLGRGVAPTIVSQYPKAWAL